MPKRKTMESESERRRSRSSEEEQEGRSTKRHRHYKSKKRYSSSHPSSHGRKKRRDSITPSEDDGRTAASHSESDEGSGPQHPLCNAPDNHEIMEYLSRKAYKKASKVSRKLKARAPGGYSCNTNPFEDSNLTEKLRQNVAPTEVPLKAEKKSQKERLVDIQKVKKIREDSKIEKARHEEEMFHSQQSKVRSEILLKDGRAKPIDIWSKNLNLSDDFDVEINEPYKIYKGLSVKEMEELRQDIRMHIDLDRATPTHIEFWEAMMVVCDWEIAEARKRDALDRARVQGEEPPPESVAQERGLHESVEGEVKNLLVGKSFNQLKSLQENIELEMSSGKAKVVEYWEAVLKRLHIFKAKARLREIHADLLRRHLNRFQEMEEEEQQSLHEDETVAREVIPSPEESEELPSRSSEVTAVEDGDDMEEEQGSFSPQLVHTFEGDEVIDLEMDKTDLDRKRAEALEEQQRRLQDASAGSVVGDDNNKRELAMKAMGCMDEGDDILGSGTKVNLESQVIQILGILDEPDITCRERSLEETMYIDSFIGHVTFGSNSSGSSISLCDWANRSKECLFGPPLFRIGRVLAVDDSYSGTGWIHGQQFVVTCAHVIHSIQRQSQDIVFQLPCDDILIDLEVVYVCNHTSLTVSYLRDIAVLRMTRVRSPPSVPLASLSIGSLDAGDPKWTMKCLTAGVLKPEPQCKETQKMINTGRVESVSEKLVTVSARADFGFSGAPVLDKHERIIGMVQGGRGHDIKTVAIIPIDRISEIIDVIISLNPTCGLPPLPVPMQVGTPTLPY